MIYLKVSREHGIIISPVSATHREMVNIRNAKLNVNDVQVNVATLFKQHLKPLLRSVRLPLPNQNPL